MRIILSRKGFDAANGGVASPIYVSDERPLGELRSLPIPQPSPSHLGSLVRYRQIAAGGYPLARVVSDLTRGKWGADDAAHLDPDLDPPSLPRQAGWRAVFGQNGSSEAHLQRLGVQAGDVFLFYGWFRCVEEVAGHYRYVASAPDLHVIFGWLQIAQRVLLRARPDVPPWARYHPHCQFLDSAEAGSLYISTPNVELPGTKPYLPGGGIFHQYADDLRLTAAGRTRRIWRLPGWFGPSEDRAALSYNANPGRWEKEGQTVLLHSAAPGQEFVLNCDDYPEALPWLSRLLNSSETRIERN